MSGHGNNHLDEVSYLASFSKQLSFFLSLNLNSPIQSFLIQGEEPMALKEIGYQRIASKAYSVEKNK